MLPFTHEQFVAVLVGYNDAIRPMQVAAYIAGIGAVALLFRRTRLLEPDHRRCTRGNVAVDRHLLPRALLCADQPCRLAVWRVVRRRGHLPGLRRTRPRPASLWVPVRAGGLGWHRLRLYAAILYPLIGLATGVTYAEMPMFGVTPCPVTIFTFGMLLLTTKRLPWRLLAIPLVWSLIGGSAAFLLAVPQDWVLLASGLIAVTLIILRDHGRHLTAAA